MITPYFQNELVTLYHGDCLAVMDELFSSGVRADFVFTDPPYGHNNNNNGDLIERWEKALGTKATAGSAPRPILGDGAEATPLLKSALARIAGLLARGGAVCCCCGGGGGPDPQFARWSYLLDEAPPKHAPISATLKAQAKER